MDSIPLEKPIVELEDKLDEVRRRASVQAINLDPEIKKLESEIKKVRAQIFKKLTPYERAQLSRHPRRPNTLELIQSLCSDFVELHGDRNFLDDRAIVGGLARFEGISVVVMGHQKGRGTKDNILRNFGMPRPEGYRKALRLMSLAERFKRPILTFVDTPGAYPGVDAEERGQSEAIAKNIMVMSQLKTPVITFVIGEGGSGGALAIAVANRVHMLEHAIYSVISPEGCASILMKDSGQAHIAAQCLKLTSNHALSLGVIDSIIPEPEGGAHKSVSLTASRIKEQLKKDLQELMPMSAESLIKDRYEKFQRMGASKGL